MVIFGDTVLLAIFKLRRMLQKGPIAVVEFLKLELRQVMRVPTVAHDTTRWNYRTFPVYVGKKVVFSASALTNSLICSAFFWTSVKRRVDGA